MVQNMIKKRPFFDKKRKNYGMKILEHREEI